MEWLLGILVAAAVVVALLAARAKAGSGRHAHRPMPKREDLEREIARLEGEIEQAKGRGDEAVAAEFLLQLRVQRHWLAKATDEGWKDYYRKSGAQALDAWGKTGAK